MLAVVLAAALALVLAVFLLPHRPFPLRAITRPALLRCRRNPMGVGGLKNVGLTVDLAAAARKTGRYALFDVDQ